MFNRAYVHGSPRAVSRIGQTCTPLGIELVEANVDDDKTDAGPDATAFAEAAKRAGAEVVHPGDAHPNEQAALGHATRAAALVFVGPPNDALDVLADRLRMRQMATSLDIPIIPGTDALHDEQLAEHAEALGYPLFAKAVAGSFGLGLTRVESAEGLLEACRATRGAGREWFADDRVYLEAALTQPRQIEITVVARSPGEAIALPERECSIQDSQRIILAESPSPGLLAMDDYEARRGALAESAVLLTQALGATGLVTFEFLLDANGYAFLLSASAGLPAGYAVTEMVTGLDLVEVDLRIAAGDAALDLAGRDRPSGHAVQARVLARAGTLQGTGLELVRWPPTLAGRSRIESELRTGDEVHISTPEDACVALLSTCAHVRHQAVLGLDRLLAGAVLTPLSTNLDALRAILNERSFMAGQYDTGFYRQAMIEP